MDKNSIKENLDKVLQAHDEKVAYTVVCPPWPELTKDQQDGSKPIPLPTKFTQSTRDDSEVDYIKKHASIATGDGCLSLMYLLFVRDLNTKSIKN